jgi:hypothetical protein
MKKYFIGYDGDLKDGLNFGMGVFCSIMLMVGLFGWPVLMIYLAVSH